MVKEIRRKVNSGYLFLGVLGAAQLLTGYGLFNALKSLNIAQLLLFALLSLIVLICWFGLFMVNPNEGKVLQIFGKYAGTAREPGLRWANPFYAKKAVSLRIRNFESGKLKVNDSNGSPIEIAAVVVWKVVDTAEAVFEVDDFEEFVTIQSEAALRNLATSYPYEAHDDQQIGLRSDPKQIAGSLRQEIQERLDKAGVEVIEARISHLAYAQEIVEGAVSMVRMALSELKEQGVIDLDGERKAAMVSNLLVVLCGEENAQPVLNTGSLYS
jgi:regulator of protease activity HflC (stomatin/prohibitin superfamily)